VGKVNAMSSLQQKLAELVNSPQAKKLTDKVQAFADDPKTKQQIDKAKRKLAEMREGGSTGGTGGAGGTGAPPDGPKAA
jgi:hypothetical protein